MKLKDTKIGYIYKFIYPSVHNVCIEKFLCINWNHNRKAFMIIENNSNKTYILWSFLSSKDKELSKILYAPKLIEDYEVEELVNLFEQ